MYERGIKKKRKNNKTTLDSRCETQHMHGLQQSVTLTRIGRRKEERDCCMPINQVIGKRKRLKKEDGHGVFFRKKNVTTFHGPTKKFLLKKGGRRRRRLEVHLLVLEQNSSNHGHRWKCS